MCILLINQNSNQDHFVHNTKNLNSNIHHLNSKNTKLNAGMFASITNIIIMQHFTEEKKTNKKTKTTLVHELYIIYKAHIPVPFHLLPLPKNSCSHGFFSRLKEDKMGKSVLSCTVHMTTTTTMDGGTIEEYLMSFGDGGQEVFLCWAELTWHKFNIIIFCFLSTLLF